jgi:hypothetical protein
MRLRMEMKLAVLFLCLSYMSYEPEIADIDERQCHNLLPSMMNHDNLMSQLCSTRIAVPLSFVVPKQTTDVIQRRL